MIYLYLHLRKKDYLIIAKVITEFISHVKISFIARSSLEKLGSARASMNLRFRGSIKLNVNRHTRTLTSFAFRAINLCTENRGSRMRGRKVNV